MDLIIKWLMMFAVIVTFLVLPGYKEQKGGFEAEGEEDDIKP